MYLNRTSMLFIFTILCRFFHVSLWYCQRYLAWIAHSWPPAQASESYYFETIHIERLLNWCFSEGLSLLSLRAWDLHRYGEFFSAPSAFALAASVRTPVSVHSVAPATLGSIERIISTS